MACKLVILVTLVAATQAAVQLPISNKEATANGVAGYTNVYDGQRYQRFTTYEPDLSQIGWNDRIISTCSTGVWIYYINSQYNLQYPGQVIWNHGIDFCSGMPSSLTRQTSSFRYAGSPNGLDESSFTLYGGQGFQGAEYYGSGSTTDLRYMDSRGQSLIITGTSSWTFYSGSGFTGYSECATYRQTDTKGSQIMHVGLYKTLSSWSNRIRSVRRGCYSTTMMDLEPLEASNQAENGASGSFVVEEQ